MNGALTNSAGLVTNTAEGSRGGGESEVSTNDGDRLTGAAPQPRQQKKYPQLLCDECGCHEIQCSAWVNANTGEVLNIDGPLDAFFCPICDQECSTLDDYGLGFELWREAENCGALATFAEALTEAKQSDRPYEIATIYPTAEVTR